MPKKLLPIREKIQNLSKPLRRQRKPPQNNSDIASDSALNLFLGEAGGNNTPKVPSSLSEAKNYYRSPFFILLSQIIIVLVFLAFLAVTGLNSFANSQIKKEEELLRAKLREIETAYPEESMDLRLISERIAVHKEYSAEFRSLAELIHLLYEAVPGLEYRSLKVDSSSAQISAQAATPLVFSLFTQKFLESGLASEVNLKSASVDSSTRYYNLSLEVRLK